MVHLPVLSRKKPLILVMTILDGDCGILILSTMTDAKPAISPCLLIDWGSVPITSFPGHRISVELTFFLMLSRKPEGPKRLLVNPPVIYFFGAFDIPSGDKKARGRPPSV